MNIRLKYTHNNRVPISFLHKPTFKVSFSINEDMSYVPRFTLKDSELFSNFPINEPTKPSLELIKQAIEYGMILNIDYKGEDDTRLEGHNRTIYPMAIGQSKDGKYLIRGYHLKGWSVSNGKVLEKEWRLFRADRLLNITFLGAFYRLAPEGYNVSGDKSIAKLIKIADFTEIRSNQEKLIKKNQIDLQDRVVVDKLNNIYTKNLNVTIKVSDPFKDDVIKKDQANKIMITFAEPVVKSSLNIPIIIIGTNIVKDKTFKLYDNNKLIGTYKSIENMYANEINTKNGTINNYSEFKSYLFIEAK